MNVAVKKLWVEHLRSDWYEQNFSIDSEGGIPLRTSDNKWSPFGILCNIHAQQFPLISEQEINKSTYLDYEYFIPDQVRGWARISKEKSCSLPMKPVKFFNKTYSSIEQLFMDGIPFFIIADIIEETF